MQGLSGDALKASSRPWSFRLFLARRKRFLLLLVLLSLVLGFTAIAYFIIKLRCNQKLLPFRLSSPFSPLQDDYPLNALNPNSNQRHHDAASSAAHVSALDAANKSMRKSQQFFRAATAAAAKGGLVLQWGDSTIRLLRGAGIAEVFFLFYEPPKASQPLTSYSEAFSEGDLTEASLRGAPGGGTPALEDPLDVFKALALEDRAEQETQPLPFVAVPKHEMHRLSFFLPEFSDKALPLAMVVRLDSGWTKFQAPLRSPYSKEKMRQFLHAYRTGAAVPLLRTEPLPPPSSSFEPVLPVVASNFLRAILEQNAHDSLVLLYANWCGHCRRFQKKMEELADRFSGISSIGFYKMDVSRNDVPVPGLRVERVPHVVFFVRDPETETDSNQQSTFNSNAAVAAARAAAAAAAGDAVAGSSWHIGGGRQRKRVITFDHTEADVVTYGEKFLLEHASCKTIDLEKKEDCNHTDGKEVDL